MTCITFGHFRLLVHRNSKHLYTAHMNLVCYCKKCNNDFTVYSSFVHVRYLRTGPIWK